MGETQWRLDFCLQILCTGCVHSVIYVLLNFVCFSLSPSLSLSLSALALPQVDADICMELLSSVHGCPTLEVLNVTNHQSAAFDMMYFQAALISYGHASQNWDKLNHTRWAFHAGQKQLLQGSANETGTSLQPVDNVCIVRALALVEHAFDLLEQDAMYSTAIAASPFPHLSPTYCKVGILYNRLQPCLPAFEILLSPSATQWQNH